MSSRLHHRLRHHGHFTQLGQQETPILPGRANQPLSGSQTCPPPQITLIPEQPEFPSRFPSLNLPFPANAPPLNQWRPSVEQTPFPLRSTTVPLGSNTFPQGLTLLPRHPSTIPPEQTALQWRPQVEQTPDFPSREWQRSVGQAPTSPTPLTPGQWRHSIEPKLLLQTTPLACPQASPSTTTALPQRSVSPQLESTDTTTNEHPPLIVFPPKQASQNRIRWADEGDKSHDSKGRYQPRPLKETSSSSASSESCSCSRSRDTSIGGSRSRDTSVDGYRSRDTSEDGFRSRDTSVDGYRSRDTSVDGYSDSGRTGEQNFNNNKVLSPEILAKYKPCPSCRLGTGTCGLQSPDPRESGSLPNISELPSSERLKELYSSHSSCNLPVELVPRESYSRTEPTSQLAKYQAGSLSSFHCAVRDDSYASFRGETFAQSCGEKCAQIRGDSCTQFRKRFPPRDMPSKRALKSKSKRSFSIKLLKSSTKQLIYRSETLHFIYIILLASATALCIRAYTTSSKNEHQKTAPFKAVITSTPLTTIPTGPIDDVEWFNKMRMRLPDDWVAVRVPDDEHEEQLLRRYFLDKNDKERKESSQKTTPRRKKKKVKVTRPPTHEKQEHFHGSRKGNSTHRHKGDTLKKQSPHPDNIGRITLRPTPGKIGHDNTNYTDPGHEQNGSGTSRGDESDYALKNHSTEATDGIHVQAYATHKPITRIPLWQDEKFIQRVIKKLEPPSEQSRKKITKTPLMTGTTMSYPKLVKPRPRQDEATIKPVEDNIIFLEEEDTQVPEPKSFLIPPLHPVGNPNSSQHRLPKSKKKELPSLHEDNHQPGGYNPQKVKPYLKFPGKHAPKESDRSGHVLSKPKFYHKSLVPKDRIEGSTEVIFQNNYFNHSLKSKRNDNQPIMRKKRPSLERNGLLGMAKDSDSNLANLAVVPQSPKGAADKTDVVQNPLIIQEPPTTPTPIESEAKYSTDPFIAVWLHLLVFTLVGSAALFLWNLHALVSGHTFSIIPFLFFNILWFAIAGLALVIYNSKYLSIACILFLLVLMHICEVSVWYVHVQPKLHRKPAKKPNLHRKSEKKPKLRKIIPF